MLSARSQTEDALGDLVAEVGKFFDKGRGKRKKVPGQFRGWATPVGIRGPTFSYIC